MKNPTRYSPARIFSVWVPEEVSGRASGSSCSRLDQAPGLASVKAWETVNPKAPLTSRVVILSRNFSGSLATISARLARLVGACSTSAVL